MESCDNFSFHWTKVTRPKNTTISVTGNELSIENICEGDFGYYRCKVLEAGKVVLTLYRALYRQDSSKIIVAEVATVVKVIVIIQAPVPISSMHVVPGPG